MVCYSAPLLVIGSGEDWSQRRRINTVVDSKLEQQHNLQYPSQLSKASMKTFQLVAFVTFAVLHQCAAGPAAGPGSALSVRANSPECNLAGEQ